MEHPSVTRSRRAQLAILSGAVALSVMGAGAAVTAQSPVTSPVPGPSASPVQGSGPSMTQPYHRGHWAPRHQGAGPRFQQLPPFAGGWDRGPMTPGDGPGGYDEARPGRASISVTAIDPPTISLATADGWTRDIDTTNVVITRDDQATTLADVNVGDSIRVDEIRNADGSYTVTGIEVLPTVISGTVATVGADSFTVTTGDGSTVTVNTTDATRWVGQRGSTGGLGSLTVGGRVIALGARAADGSISATAVLARGIPTLRPNQPQPVTPSPSPVANQG